MNKRILITGCSGFLASHLLDILAKEGDLVLSGITEIKEFTSPRLDVYHVDIRERQEVFDAVEAIRPDLTFHLAAVSNVGFSWKHQQLTYEVNFVGTSNLFEALSRHSPGSRVLLMSSAEVYGASKNKLCKETHALLPPKNPYSLSKVAMEMVGDLYNDLKKLEIIKLRAFNFTGPGQSDQFMASDFSHQIAEIEKGNRKPVIWVGNLSAVRDISDVRDIARYLNIIAKKGESGKVYNLCSGNTYSIEAILKMLISYSTEKINFMVDPNKFRDIDVPRLAGNNKLIRKKFKLYPECDIKQTLSDLLNYWRDRVGGGNHAHPPGD